ncbi:hypothetical protein V2A60_005926 [Cordyceps javanica]|uniref:Uncharacterized protein n=1 Tax=Cordyceps javanica TaxID=43265 RepID=A0A545UR87_9HYPO|nr:hypothetical protein IF1G_09565 [Cordyceps javanica]TQW03926.1 hypothetical protein IF2G_08755 [Cordyceps javanica]
MSAKFILLPEPIAATEASNLICRVVASKTAPLMAAAPFNNNVADCTLSMAIPKCSAPIKLTDFMSMARNQGVAPQVSRLLDFQGMHREEQTILLECRMVKRYLLPDPDNTFRNLMKSDDYSRDVKTLLEQCIARQGYFVTGFLTATDDSWLIEASQQELQHFNIPLPYSDSTDVPVPFLYQDFLGPDLAIFSQPCEQPSKLAHEQIFAVSYKVAKLPQAMSPTSPMSGRLSPATPPAPRRPKRSNGYHLASRRTEDAWASSNGSSPEMLPYYDDSVKIDDDDTLSLQMEEAAFIVV